MSSRLSALWAASPRRVLAMLTTLVAATALAVGSGANFTSASANPANTFSAGTLSHVNDKSGSALLTAARIKPGDSSTGTVDITNNGDIPGTFRLSASSVTNSDATNLLSSKLDLRIEDCGSDTSCASPTTRYTGKLDGMTAPVALGTFAAGDVRRFRFTVVFPDGGASGADNAYMGDSTSVRFDWESAS